jgi:ribosomal protein L31
MMTTKKVYLSKKNKKNTVCKTSTDFNLHLSYDKHPFYTYIPKEDLNPAEVK